MPESEVWRDIVGYEGVYQVSDKGDVHSVKRRDVMGRECGGRTLKSLRNKNGYLHVHLYKNGIMKSKWIHRLVAEVFIPNPEKFLEVNHRDEVKDNNELSNLEWCDSRYNKNYGTSIKISCQKRCKKVKAVNVESGEVLKFSSVKEAGCKGYAQGYVSKACRGVYKGSNGKLIDGGNLYRGHRWSYEEEN